MTDTTQHTDTKAVVERCVAAVEAGDGAAVRDLFAESATWRLFGDMPMSGTWRGRDTIIDEFLSGALGSYEPGSIPLEITAIVADGDRAVVEWTSRARTSRVEAYENFCIGAFTVRDGKIQGVREYTDTAYAKPMLFSADQAEA
jgi:uncharacterized protein